MFFISRPIEVPVVFPSNTPDSIGAGIPAQGSHQGGQRPGIIDLPQCPRGGLADFGIGIVPERFGQRRDGGRILKLTDSFGGSDTYRPAKKWSGLQEFAPREQTTERVVGSSCV